MKKQRVIDVDLSATFARGVAVSSAGEMESLSPLIVRMNQM